MKFSDNKALDVLYLDNHLLVVNKPPLLCTQPTDIESDSVEIRAKNFLKEKFQKKGNVFAHPAHRLDRVASGIVVVARTSKALSRLNEQIRNHQWKKRYTLRYEGILPSQKGHLVDNLLRLEYRSEVVGPEDGKKAELIYQATGKNRVEVELVTGRYHQIRAQFAHINCPICGDRKYGAKTKGVSPGIDLHHFELEFFHPTTKELVHIKSAPPF